MKKYAAFSLVELSIVLVILGLLVGGILAGKSLIHAAELRSVMEEYDRFRTAGSAFRDRYFGLPGDITNATHLWGKSSTYCNGQSGSVGTPGTCNGNGDGALSATATANSTAEEFQAWNQLALAGLVEGTYTGASDVTGSTVAVPGRNVPASKIPQAGWSIWYAPHYTGNAGTFAYDYGNAMQFGRANTAGRTYSSIITQAEAWNIDTKADDGRPGSGHWIAANWSGCTNATTMTDTQTTYRLASNYIACSMLVAHAF